MLILVNPIGLENYLQYVEYKDTDFFYKNELAKTPEGLNAINKKTIMLASGMSNMRHSLTL